MLCLRSIRRYTRGASIPYEVIVVDNRSGDASTEYLKKLSWIRYIENENVSTIPFNALDLGVRYSKGELILIMHTDTFVRREGWLDELVRLLGSDTMIVGSVDRVIMPINPIQKLESWWKRKRMQRFWRKRGKTPKIISHCVLYRRELFTKHGQFFDHPLWVNGVFQDCGEPIQRYCEEKGLGIRLVDREKLFPLLWHFEGATLNMVTKRDIPLKRRFRSRRFYRRPEIRATLVDSSLDE